MYFLVRLTIFSFCINLHRLIDAYRKVHKLAEVLSYFSTRNWIMPNDNVQKLWSILNDHDKQSFYFNLENINWKEYFRNHISGIKQYVLSEDMEALPHAMKKRKR